MSLLIKEVWEVSVIILRLLIKKIVVTNHVSLIKIINNENYFIHNPIKEHTIKIDAL